MAAVLIVIVVVCLIILELFIQFFFPLNIFPRISKINCRMKKVNMEQSGLFGEFAKSFMLSGFILKCF